MSFPFQASLRLPKILAWLRQGNAYASWQNRLTISVAWVALLVAVIHPPHGTSVQICWFKYLVGLSCPGCGITRSLSCGVRGMFIESWQYHPMGLLFLAGFLATAIVSVLPAAARQRIEVSMNSHRFGCNLFYLTFVLVFVGFGMTRAMIEFFHHIPK